MDRQSRPHRSRPRDFLGFWQKTLAELEGVCPNLVREPLDTDSTDLALEGISFLSLGHRRIQGYFLRPRDEERGPLVIHAHGYGSSCTVQWDWARAGFNVVGIDVRGFGRSKPALPKPSRWGYVLSGISTPETSVLRGAVCDYVRAAEIGQSLLAPSARRTVFYGRSFGGAIALMAEGVAHAADLLAVGVPTFGWAEGRYFFVKDGSGQEINAYLHAYPDHTEDVMLVLRYFDSIHFAGITACPTLIGIGLEDMVVPADTVYAIAKQLAGPVEIMEFPVSHTNKPEEALWERFEARWEYLAKEGIPSDFGHCPERPRRA